MKPAYTDSNSNLLYLREDGLLFVQLSKGHRSALKELKTGMFCLFQQPYSMVKGTIYAITNTGVVLDGWEIKSCR